MKLYIVFMITCFMSIISRMAISADNKFVNPNKRRTELFKINIHALPKEYRIQKTNDFTKYSLLDSEAEQNSGLRLFDINKPINLYNKMQTQIILVIEGNIELHGNEKKVLLESGQTYKIPKGLLLTLTPIDGPSRCLFIDFLHFDYCEDLFKNPIYEGYYHTKFNKGDYVVYDLIPGELTGQNWSLAILEINDSPNHYHKFGKEIFVVMNGELNIEVDGTNYLIKPGDLVHISANKIHHLKSAKGEKPVRVLCVNFPAFNPEDMYILT